MPGFTSARLVRRWLCVIAVSITGVGAGACESPSGSSEPLVVTKPPEPKPPEVAKPTVTGVSVGHERCALTSAGKAYCWSKGFSAQPVAVFNVPEFRVLAVGNGHACGVAADAGVYCWGYNTFGQVGNGASGQLTPEVGTPARVQAPVRFMSVAAGLFRTCALAEDGSAFCWGANDRNGLGTGVSTTNCADARRGGFLGCQPTPAAVITEVRFATLSVGDQYTCGLTNAGEAYCWGGGPLGQAESSADPTSSIRPVAVAGGYRFTQISAGNSHACGLQADGRALCWGYNTFGGVGADVPTLPNRLVYVPVPVATTVPFRAISAGWAFTCGLATDGTAYCWGLNESGQLGDGTTQSRSAPVPVSTDTRFTALSAGASGSCALTQVGEVYCWGWSADGSRSLVPVAAKLPS